MCTSKAQLLSEISALIAENIDQIDCTHFGKVVPRRQHSGSSIIVGIKSSIKASMGGQTASSPSHVEHRVRDNSSSLKSKQYKEHGSHKVSFISGEEIQVPMERSST